MDKIIARYPGLVWRYGGTLREITFEVNDVKLHKFYNRALYRNCFYGPNSHSRRNEELSTSSPVPVGCILKRIMTFRCFARGL